MADESESLVSDDIRVPVPSGDDLAGVHYRAFTAALTDGDKHAARLIGVDQPRYGETEADFRARARHERETAEAGIEEADAAALRAAGRLADRVAEAAMPPLPDDVTEAREELRAILDQPNEERMVAAVQQAAADPRYARLLGGPWGRALLVRAGSADLHDIARESLRGNVKESPAYVAAVKKLAIRRYNRQTRAEGAR